MTLNGVMIAEFANVRYLCGSWLLVTVTNTFPAPENPLSSPTISLIKKPLLNIQKQQKVMLPEFC